MTGERLIPGLNGQAQLLPQESDTFLVPEFNTIAERLLPSESSVFTYLAQRFEETVASAELYQSGMGYFLIGDWQNHLQQSIFRIRRVLPEKFSVYGLHGFARYSLDWRRADGSRFVPKDWSLRAEEFPEPVQPLMRFCYEARVDDDRRLAPRLTGIQLGIMETLGRAYPNAVGNSELFHMAWNHDPVIVESENALRTQIHYVRGKIGDFDQGRFEIVSRPGQYALV